jgi:Alpha/beta-hydrolase family
MDRALFLGTPAGSQWARQWRLDQKLTDPDGEVAEIASYGEWLALPADDRGRRRYVLLSHHEDPITRFEPALIVQERGWLGPAAARPPGVSHLACWYPLTTFVLTLVDVKNAMDVTPGRFAARGHDYRADLARMASEAYGLPPGTTSCWPSSTLRGAARRRGPSGAWPLSSSAGPRRPSSARPGPGAWPRAPPPAQARRDDEQGQRPSANRRSRPAIPRPLRPTRHGRPERERPLPAMTLPPGSPAGAGAGHGWCPG